MFPNLDMSFAAVNSTAMGSLAGSWWGQGSGVRDQGSGIRGQGLGRYILSCDMGLDSVGGWMFPRWSESPPPIAAPPSA